MHHPRGPRPGLVVAPRIRGMAHATRVAPEAPAFAECERGIVIARRRRQRAQCALERLDQAFAERCGTEPVVHGLRLEAQKVPGVSSAETPRGDESLTHGDVVHGFVQEEAEVSTRGAFAVATEGTGSANASLNSLSTRVSISAIQNERINRSTRSSCAWNGSLQRIVSRSGSFSFKYTQSTR